MFDLSFHSSYRAEARCAPEMDLEWLRRRWVDFDSWFWMGVETKGRKRLILILDGFGMKRAHRRLEEACVGGEREKEREREKIKKIGKKEKIS